MRRFRLCIAVLICAAVLPFTARTAAACPLLDHAEPRVGSVVTKAPAEVRLYFTGAVETKDSTLHVTGAQGSVYALGALFHPGGDTSAIAVKLKQLPPGRYKAEWGIHCTCGEAMHSVIPGNFSFTVSGP